MKVRTNLDVEQEVKRVETIFENQPYRDEMVTLDLNVEKCVNTSFQMKVRLRWPTIAALYNFTGGCTWQAVTAVVWGKSDAWHTDQLQHVLIATNPWSLLQHDYARKDTVAHKLPRWMRTRLAIDTYCVCLLLWFHIEMFVFCRPKGETLLLGTQEQLRLHINVKNAGDDAHQARVRIGVPPGIRTESTQIALADGEHEDKRN